MFSSGYKARYFVSKPLDGYCSFIFIIKSVELREFPTEFPSSIVWTKKISYGLQLYGIPALLDYRISAGHFNARIRTLWKSA